MLVFFPTITCVPCMYIHTCTVLYVNFMYSTVHMKSHTCCRDYMYMYVHVEITIVHVIISHTTCTSLHTWCNNIIFFYYSIQNYSSYMLHVCTLHVYIMYCINILCKNTTLQLIIKPTLTPSWIVRMS